MQIHQLEAAGGLAMLHGAVLGNPCRILAEVWKSVVLSAAAPHKYALPDAHLL
ncbi:MAG: hypothetical protein V4631_15500 [Pseudomonadota bacterium]